MSKTAVVLVAIFFLCVAGAHAQAKIEIVKGTTVYLGDAYAGTKADGIIEVKNVGNDTLFITEVKAQCGCTAALMSDQDKRLAPKAIGKVSLSFNTQGYGGQKVTKQVYISSSDTATPKTTISLSVNVINILDMNPKFLSFDNSKVDTTYTKTVTVSNPSKDPITILSATSSIPEVKVALLKKQLMPGESTTLQAELHPTKSGTFNGEIELVTNHKVQPKFSVKFFAWVNRQ